VSPVPAELEEEASADDIACLFALSRAQMAQDLGEEASSDDALEPTTCDTSNMLAPEPAPTKPLEMQVPTAEKLCHLTEQRELLERFNRLVLFDQLIQSKIQKQKKIETSDMAEPMGMNDMPEISSSAQPTPQCKTTPRTTLQPEIRRSSLRLKTFREEEPVPVVPSRIRAPTQPSETQRPTPVQLLRQQKETRAKQETQEHHIDTKLMGVLAGLIELKDQLQMQLQTKMTNTKASLESLTSGLQHKGHVILKSLATQAKGDDAVLSLSDGKLSLVGGAELDQTLLSMPFSHIVLEPVPCHDNCIHFKTTKKNDKTAGVIIVLPSRSIRDDWLAASSSMNIKIEKWRSTLGVSCDCTLNSSGALQVIRWLS